MERDRDLEMYGKKISASEVLLMEKSAIQQMCIALLWACDDIMLLLLLQFTEHVHGIKSMY